MSKLSPNVFDNNIQVCPGGLKIMIVLEENIVTPIYCQPSFNFLSLTQVNKNVTAVQQCPLYARCEFSNFYSNFICCSSVDNSILHSNKIKNKN